MLQGVEFAVSRLFWFIAALDGFYRAETLFWSIMWAGISVVMMVSPARGQISQP